jgi:hypothetical protein
MAFTYCVTFRVADRTVDGQTYSERRQSIIDAVRGQNLGYWEETTSFFITESGLSTPDLARDASAGLSEQYDMLVAFDPSDMSMAYFGAIQHPDVLASFFRTAKKVP